jgi:hypothetical protein
MKPAHTLVYHDPKTNRVLATVNVPANVKNLENHFGHKHKEEHEVKNLRSLYRKKFFAKGKRPPTVIKRFKKWLATRSPR